MGDSAAVRAKRYRQHGQGDHSLCVAGRCPAKGGTPRADVTPPKVGAVVELPTAGATVVGPPDAGANETAPSVGDTPPPADGERVPGGIEKAVIAFCAALPYREPDPRALLAQIAIRLAQRVDETGALPAAVRELRVLLVQLTEVPNGPSGIVDETRLRSAQRKLDRILATAV